MDKLGGAARRNHFEANIQTAFAFKGLGKYHWSVENFTRLMNTHGLSCKGYEKIEEEIHSINEKLWQPKACPKLSKK